MGGESDPIGGVLELGVVVDKFGDKSVPIIELFTDWTVDVVWKAEFDVEAATETEANGLSGWLATVTPDMLDLCWCRFKLLVLLLLLLLLLL